MKRTAFLSLLALALSAQAPAQSFIGEITANKTGEGTLTVNQAPEIDRLVNETRLSVGASGQQAPAASTKGQGKPGAEPSGTAHAKDRAASPKSTGIMKTDEETGTAASGKKVMKNGVKVDGYRVQAFSGGNTREDRTMAESTGHAIKTRYPGLPVYVHFYSPRWICRVGNFLTFEEASAVLKDIKAMGYKDACIVKGKISVTQ